MKAVVGIRYMAIAHKGITLSTYLYVLYKLFIKLYICYASYTQLLYFFHIIHREQTIFKCLK